MSGIKISHFVFGSSCYVSELIFLLYMDYGVLRVKFFQLLRVNYEVVSFGCFLGVME